MSSDRLFADNYEAPGYTLLNELGNGKGNTARVFKATRHADDTEVAIKFYNPLKRDADGKLQKLEPERFSRESLAVRDINHPNVVKVIECSGLPADVGSILKPPFMVMKLLNGDLRDKLKINYGPRFLNSTVGLLRRVADGLLIIHKNNVIHRDIKPDNIMFDGDEPQLADFGFAILYGEQLTEQDILARVRRTVAGERIGTLAYASPEQIAAAPFVTTQTDVFSFGVMMFELLTGTPPFSQVEGEDADAYAKRRLNPPEFQADQLDSKIDEELRKLCVRCLRAFPLSRPGTEEVASILLTVERKLANKGG